jgi:DHA2 family multidrug resistance protein
MTEPLPETSSGAGPGPPTPQPSTVPASTTANKWLVAAAMMLGTFLVVMDISVVNVALPHMMGSFAQNLSAITWVATSYSIAEIIMLTMAGWWTTLLGRKRLYLLSLALFIGGSVLAGTARTFPQMLIYRTIQGIGGGSLIPASQAILRETFPPRQQGMAMAIYGMGVVLAPALGPVVGGWLTDRYGWPWIFYINVPFSLVGMLLVNISVEDPPYLRRGVMRTDWLGIALLAIGLTGMQIVLERGEEKGWLESNWIVGASVITGIALTLLVVRELRAREPIVDLRLFRNVPLSVGSAMGLIFGVALFGTTFVLPAFAQNLLGYSAYESGMVLLPRAIALFAVMPLAGWLYNYLDARLLVGFGVAILYWSYQDLAHLSLDLSLSTLVPPLLLLGAGMPFIFVTMTTVSVATIPREDMTAASSLYTLARRVGGNMGYALVATLVDRRSQLHRANLVPNITNLSPLYPNLQAGLTSYLLGRGFDPVTAHQKALALIDTTVNRQAAMLAYNDISWFFAIIFLAALPLLLFLPRRRISTYQRGITH